MSRLEELLRDLPPEYEQEVEAFVRSLTERRGAASPRPLRLHWRGALRDIGAKYTSVELQHAARDWRVNQCT